MMSDNTDSEYDQSIIEEIEALKAIMFSELDVTYAPSGRPLELQTTLYPSTADDTGQYYVCLQLHMKFPPKYPDEQPVVELRNPRGLGEDFLASVMRQCREKCACFEGSPVIYELIELLRDCLTNSNRPTGHCTICLFDFHPEDVFVYTQCYHHFHSHCLSRFCESMQEQWKEEEEQEAANAANWREKKTKMFTCPVCREVINVDLAALKQAPPPYEVERFNDTFEKDAKYTAWKNEMEETYLKQKANGGIIDREAEDSRFLVVTDISSSSTETTPSPEDDSLPRAPVEVEASAPKKPAQHKPEWSRGRGKFIHRPETHGKDKSRNVRPASHPPRHSKESSHSKERPSEASIRPAASRPPPGFQPR